MNTLSMGGTYTLTFGTAYALPPKSCRLRVYQSGGTITTSPDNSHYATITLDSNLEFVTAAGFIKAATADAIVNVKET